MATLKWALMTILRDELFMRTALDSIHLNLFICAIEAFALEVCWCSCYYLDHRLITVCTWNHWSIVPSMGDLILDKTLRTSIVVGWHVRHFLIM